MEKSEFPEHITPRVGQKLQLTHNDGRVIDLRVAEIEGEMVTLETHHPLSGHTLIYEVELVDVA